MVNKPTWKITSELLMILPFLIVFSTVFINAKELENGLVSGKYFWFYGSTALTSAAALIYSLFNRKEFRFSRIDGLVFLFAVSVFLSALFFNDASANTTKLVISLLLFVLYLCLRLVINSNRQVIRLLCFFIVLTGFVEAGWGLLQIYGFLPSQHSLFKITGSFFNPGPYAGYLAVVFPLALYGSLPCPSHRGVFKWIVSAMTAVAILLVLPAGMSRASWLAVIAGSVVVLAGRWRGVFTFSGLLRRFTPRNDAEGRAPRNDALVKTASVVLGICLTAASIAGMYFLKKDSADGRLLIWKVSASAIIQHPLGVGLGHFPHAYGETQAAYFASGKATETEEYVAGNPEYGFNEFLQIAVESGIVGLLLFIGMLVCAFRGLIQSKNRGAAGSLAALLVFACFSYPFSVLPFPIVLVFLLAMSSGGTPACRQTGRMKRTEGMNACLSAVTTDYKSVKVIFTAVGCAIVTAFCLWREYPVYQAYSQWKSCQIYYRTGMYKEAVQGYEPLYPYLNDQIRFLFEYGRSLSQTERPQQNSEVLRHATKISCDPMLYNIIGKNCQAMKEYDTAEKSFRKAALIVPFRKSVPGHKKRVMPEVNEEILSAKKHVLQHTERC